MHKTPGMSGETASRKHMYAGSWPPFPPFMLTCVHKGVVHSHDLHAWVRHGSAQHQPADATEAVDADAHRLARGAALHSQGRRDGLLIHHIRQHLQARGGQRSWGVARKGRGACATSRLPGAGADLPNPGPKAWRRAPLVPRLIVTSTHLAGCSCRRTAPLGASSRNWPRNRSLAAERVHDTGLLLLLQQEAEAVFSDQGQEPMITRQRGFGQGALGQAAKDRNKERFHNRCWRDRRLKQACARWQAGTNCLQQNPRTILTVGVCTFWVLRR